MKLLRLYIKNFMCHENSFIDFTQFSAALIVGKLENNDLFSNGVGKTTIFKAIEYVLFNQADVNLEKIVRDDTPVCQIVMDFMVGTQEYRVSRTRTRKGNTDLSLFQRNAMPGEECEVYHIISDALDTNINGREMYTPIMDEKYWKDISGRRAADTEKDLAKLIKLNYKSFRSTIHFIQNDFSGLTTATPEKRKAILKDALNLIIYSKLEKLAKDKYNILSKDIDKTKLLIENLGTPDKDLIDLNKKISETDIEIRNKTKQLNKDLLNLEKLNAQIGILSTDLSNLENKFASLITQEQSLVNEKSRMESSIKEYTTKKNNVVKVAQDLVNEINKLKDAQVKLAQIDYSKIDILNEEISQQQNEIFNLNLAIQNQLYKYEELKIPLPAGSKCKDCQQTLTKEHRDICQKQIDKDLKICQKNIDETKNSITKMGAIVLEKQQNVNSLSLSKQQLESLNIKISTKNKEILDKRAMHDEYNALLDKHSNDLKSKLLELNVVQQELKSHSMEESKNIKSQINNIKEQINSLNIKSNSLRKEITQYTSNKAVLQHNIDQKNQDKSKIIDLKKALETLEKDASIYPSVIQAFSSTGIPNLIIQNVLDDLQVEANALLSQLKPGLQLSFFVEKTKTDGTEADTLDIKYFVNNKERYYEVLSGAMKLAVTFSLKLGLSFLLSKMMGTDIKFLLLDEIDQSLDKAGVDAFADIVKFFQKDFTILVITHNDRLKDKFSHAILVEQDINMVSRAMVVSSW